MPSIQYIGVAPIHETAITGKQQKWFPGQIQQVSDADAALLKASGLGFVNEPVAPGDLSPATVAALQAQVSGDGNITEAELLTVTPAEVGGIYVLRDGPNKGAKLTWAVPESANDPTWCWWLWPQSAYEG